MLPAVTSDCLLSPLPPAMAAADPARERLAHPVTFVTFAAKRLGDPVTFVTFVAPFEANRP